MDSTEENVKRLRKYIFLAAGNAVIPLRSIRAEPVPERVFGDEDR